MPATIAGVLVIVEVLKLAYIAPGLGSLPNWFLKNRVYLVTCDWVCWWTLVARDSKILVVKKVFLFSFKKVDSLETLQQS